MHRRSTRSAPLLTPDVLHDDMEKAISRSVVVPVPHDRQIQEISEPPDNIIASASRTGDADANMVYKALHKVPQSRGLGSPMSSIPGWYHAHGLHADAPHFFKSSRSILDALLSQKASRSPWRDSCGDVVFTYAVHVHIQTETAWQCPWPDQDHPVSVTIYHGRRGLHLELPTGTAPLAVYAAICIISRHLTGDKSIT